MSNKIQKGVFDKLSKREIEIIILMLKGKRNIEIANELGIKPNTISTFKKSCFIKLGVTNLIELYKITQV